MPDAGSVWVDVLPDLKKFGPRLRAELKAHADKGMDVPLGLDSAKARTELDAFRREVTKVGNLSPTVKVSANTRSALSGLVGVEKAADRLDGRVVNVQVRTTGNRPVQPTVAPTGGGGGSTPTTSRSNSPGGGGGSQRPFTDLSPAASAGVWTLIPPLVPAVGALAGGLGAVASGFTAAGVGAGAFALAAVPAIKDATEATDDLTQEQEIFRDSLGGLNAAWREFRAQTDGPVLVAAAQGVDAAQVGLSKLAPTTVRTAHAFADLADEARAGMDGPRWTSFFSFLSRQATPSTLTFGRSLGNLATGVAGFVMNMEPLWNEVGPGLEDMTASFADWGHDSSNFTDFIAWTIENGPTFVDMFGQIAETAVDVGVALGPLGTVYAEGLTAFAGAISAVAETAPWLIQVAVAAKTAHIAFQLFGRANTGLIQPLRELPGRVREYATQLGTVAPAADGAAGGSNRLKGAIGGVYGALGGPLGIGIAAAVTGIGILIAKKQEATQAAKEFQDAIEADGGALEENTRKQIANNLAEEGAVKLARDLKVDLELVTDALLGNEDAREQVNGALERYIEAQNEAERAGSRGETQTSRMSDKAHELKNILDGQNGAIAEGVEGYNDAQAAMAALGLETDEEKKKQEGLNEALAEGAFQARDLKAALDNLTGAHIAATEAESNFEAAVDRATEAAQENGKTLDLNTEAGRENDEVLRGIRETTNEFTDAVRENDGSVAEQIQTAERGRKKFIDVAKQMGYTADEAEDLADEYLGIPSDVESQIRLAATGKWSVPYSADTGAGTSVGNGLSFYAEGGPVHGAGTATSDSIPAMLSDGEFVEPTHVVNHYGPGFFEALRHKAIPKEKLPGFATGGWVTKGVGSTPWDILDDHRTDVRPSYNRMVWELIGRVGDTMGEQWKDMIAGPTGVARLAEASIGKYPEVPNGSNRNAITDWYGMSGAAWCAQFISWLFAQTGASRALGGAARTAWTGDYYTSGMRRTNTPMPGDVAVYGTDHVNLITSPGGGRRVGGNQSNNVTAAPYSGGAIFRPNWGAVGFAEGGRVSIADIMAQDQREDERAGVHPVLRGVHEIMGLADGGLASGWTVVGEEGPELARFDDPARIYSTQESARMLATASQAATQVSGGSKGALIDHNEIHLHDSQATVREAMADLTHTLRVVDHGGLYG